MKIAFRVDASAEIGTGHVMRCLTLAQELRDCGNSIVFICREHLGHLISLIQALDFVVVSLAPVVSNNVTGPLRHSKWVGVSQKNDLDEINRMLKSDDVASMYGTVSPDPRIYGASGSNNPPFYGAAKAGLIQLTRYLACHLAASNIRVNSVSPGAFPPDSIRRNQPDFHAELCAKTPLGRIGVPREVAEPIVFLLGAAASYITGANLPIDGGWTVW
jgi:NAD(P)-dependent dehydrogenase (short-subunit alcohol dehydrogenase family)